jgi:ribosomal protein S18 acetylase RimI-like enzyme
MQGECVFRAAREADYPDVACALQTWWTLPGLGEAGARERAALLPRLWLQHFSSTSLVVERDGRFAAFLVGFLSADRPDEGYIHFVGVAPDARGVGLGRSLYRHFFATCRRAGRTRVRCVTSPANTASIAFHAAMGFGREAGDDGDTAVPSGAMRDYDGPGVHRVAFVRELLPEPAGPIAVTRLAPGEPVGRDFAELVSGVFVGEGYVDAARVGDALEPAVIASRGTPFVARAAGGLAAGLALIVDPENRHRQVAIGGELEVHLMAVAPAQRRAGVGSALLDACIHEARRREARRLVLSTQPTMTAAHALYEKHGFARNQARDWTRRDGRHFWVYELTLR